MIGYLMQMSADAVLIVYAYGVSGVARGWLGAPYESLVTLAYAMGPFVAIHLASLLAFEAYDFRRLRSESDVAFSALLGSLTGTAFSFLVSMTYILYYTPNASVVGRSVFIAGGTLCAILLPGWRVWYTRMRRRRGELETRVLACGSASNVGALAEELVQYSRSGHKVIGCVATDSHTPEQPGCVPFLGTVDALAELIRAHAAHEVLLLGDALSRDSHEMMRIIKACEDTGVVAHVLPGNYEALVGRLDLYEIGGLPLIELKCAVLSPRYAAVKRAMDIVGAVAGLFFASPILLAAGIAIKLDSPGPVFYSQMRSGRLGREYRMYKLRSMRHDAEEGTGPQWAAKEDPRVTRVGRFLRRKRIDEIPQLWNVLIGDMSLVGPRPERPYFIEKFRQEVPLFPLRLRVRPGVTSLSHVWGRYDSSPQHRLLYDLVYMSNVSLLLDLRIMVDTVKIVLTGRGAQ
ncbi:MAG: sugar transferase [Candidatus Hydrogenedentes bacterium]|nr:sugar transferase [Candidatus Hydrogenedentota bacterium]